MTRRHKPYKKRVRGLLITCKCGQEIYDDKVGHALHDKSVRHRRYRRILALLKTDCLTFQEIGERVGVSRERVRQLALTIEVTGNERVKACTINRYTMQHEERFKSSRAARLAARLTEVGLSWQRVAARAGFRNDLLTVNGNLVKVKQCYKWRGYYRLTAGMASASVTIYEMPISLGWLIVPTSRMVIESTMFTLTPTSGKPGASRSRHDWPDMLNRWETLL